MSLVEYRRKRQFDKTSEPQPGNPLPKGQRAIFVVQLHHASRRHYDFRLQVGDALKSWAVPKGPSYDPDVKRMAVEVEDHPVDYAAFEGEIPKGEYGGGHVARFDHGVWSTQGDAEAQLAKGHLRFELFGEKLKGGWHLVRTGKRAKQPQWLLFKAKDAFAGSLEADDLLANVASPPAADAKRAGSGKPDRQRKSTVPAPKRRKRDWATLAAAVPGARKQALGADPFKPQLARLGDKPPQGEDWLHEIKWDGYRLVAKVHDGNPMLWSRNGLSWSDRVPEVAQAIAALGLSSAALDGELIAGQGTKDDFGLLQGTLSGERQGVLSYVLFDLLHLEGWDLTRASLSDRKALLAQLLDPAPAHLAYSSHVPVDGATAFELASERQFEGIISKRPDGIHHAGRSDDWRKTKSLESDEFAVVGYTQPKGTRSGFGALLLASPTAGGWRYVGKVGSGFSDALLDRIADDIGSAGRKAPTVEVPEHDTDLRTARWFAPRFVVEVFYRGRGSEGLLRQPSLKTLREDKTVTDLKTGPGPRPSKKSKKSNTTKATNARKAPELTSPTKVVFPDKNVTKRQVADYYLAVVEHLLPEILGRPLSIVRCPGGIGTSCFFQKHHTAGLDVVSFERLTEEDGNKANYLVVNDEAGLMELVQFNALEFHPWGSHADGPDQADRIVFDLDPGPGVAWKQVVDAARYVRKLLESVGLVSFVRTSGGKGLHVVVPLNPGCDWSLVKPFAKAFAEGMVRIEPLKYVATSSKKFRNRKIFVDYLRNGRGATSVASYSLRAREGAPVAMPLRWEELSRVKSGAAFDITSAQARLKRLRSDPWKDIDRVKQDLSQWEGDANPDE